MLDLTNQRFTRLIAIKPTEKRKRGQVIWVCHCDCGNIVEAPCTELTAGRKKSCGCYRHDVSYAMAKTGDHRRTHGMKKIRIYHVWCSIKGRCNNANYRQYKDYGGRGIKICKEWEKDFQAFHNYVSKLPHYGEVGYSIDRINNNGNYEPGNIRYATRTEQNRNRRNVKSKLVLPEI